MVGCWGACYRQDMAAYTADIAEALAAALAVPVRRVVVTSVAAGSVAVSFYLAPPAAPGAPTETALYTRLGLLAQSGALAAVSL